MWPGSSPLRRPRRAWRTTAAASSTACASSTWSGTSRCSWAQAMTALAAHGDAGLAGVFVGMRGLLVIGVGVRFERAAPAGEAELHGLVPLGVGVGVVPLALVLVELAHGLRPACHAELVGRFDQQVQQLVLAL